MLKKLLYGGRTARFTTLIYCWGFCQVLDGGIRDWIHTGRSDFRVVLADYPTHMRETLHLITKEQEQIGWSNALKGFLSCSWIDLASMRYENTTRSLVEGTKQLRERIRKL
jgi:hypothetical protein